MKRAAKIPHSPAAAGLLLVLIAATLIPLLVVGTPPMVDVPGHIGRFVLQTQLDEHAWWQTYYQFRWRIIGNLGADLIVQALHPLVGVTAAVRLVALLVPLLAASAILLLARESNGRLTAGSVMALTLIYGLPFTWGFLNFSLAMALALWAFLIWLKLIQAGRTVTRGVVFVLVSLVVWTCHAYGWAFLCILCASESLVRRYNSGHRIRSIPDVIADLLPLLAPLAPMVLWRSGDGGSGVSGWFDGPQKLQWIVSLFRLEHAGLDIASAAFVGATIGFGLFSRHVRLQPIFTVAATASACAYIVLPKQIFGSVFADMRLVPYVVILALLALDDRERSPAWRAAWMGLAVVFLILRLSMTAQVYHERSRILDRHLAALALIPAHSRVAMLVQLPCTRDWRMPWTSHLGSLALTRKEIFVNDLWANARMNPLSVRFPAAGDYATDDKQLYFPARCAGDQPKLEATLRALPTRAFTHVWIVGTDQAPLLRRPDLRRVWRHADAGVFAVRPAASSASSAH